MVSCLEDKSLCSFIQPREIIYIIIPYTNILMLTQRAPIPAETGKKVSNYIYYYQDLIGKGNFAKVYRAIHLVTKQTVAIKAISLDQLKSKRLEALVFEEIRILQLMNHPYVLEFHQALLSDRNCYIVTELCNGGNLEEKIKRGPIPNVEIASIILQLFEGLRYLKSMDVVHRDFKAANIFLHNGKVKIADFGLAKLYKERFNDLDIGSPHYMSPEGLLLNVYSEKTDVWALGIVIYEMIHGKTPFGYCRLDSELKYWIVRPLADNMFKKDIHPCFKQLILTLLEVDENRRISIGELSKSHFVENLEEIMRNIKSENSDKRKFSFNGNVVTPQLFQKKIEVNYLNAKVSLKNEVNKSMQVNTSIHPLKPNNSFTGRPTISQPMAPRPSNFHNLTLKPNNRESLKLCFTNPPPTVPLTSMLQKPLNFWQGEVSSKTNETRQSDSQQKYMRTRTERSIYNTFK